MSKRILLAASCFLFAALPAHAVEEPIRFREFDVRSADSVSLWRDFVPGLGAKEPRASDEGKPAATLIWQKKIGNTTWTVTYLDALAFCSVNSCQARVFKDRDLVLDTMPCRDANLYVLRPDADELAACNVPFKLNKIDQQ